MEALLTGEGPKQLQRTLVQRLAKTIGEVQAKRLVEKTGAELRVDLATLDSDGVLQILCALADMPGLVGVVARLVRAEFRASMARSVLSGGTL
jgi:hypothetical protein